MSSRGRAAADAVIASRRRSSRGSGNAIGKQSGSGAHGVGDPSDAGKKQLRIKILTMGDAGTGKSCLVKRYCEERFVSKYISTIGIDYGVKPTTLKGRDVRVNFWDMSGNEAFFEVRNEFYKDCSGAILVYDVTNKKSFDALPGWLEEARKYGAAHDMPIIVCANKVDKRRVVQESDGMQFAVANGLSHWDTSAQSGANVTDVFETLFTNIIERPPING
ncbi:hypothetical protein TrVE_jg1418 [Triparma verrucosa]|uniref:Uncharacterized protein n=1 Tax=Triparma verrucosa TaxID=1606542 RepID=A0A9W7CDM9_9STRA|nr:hypothetical protein TrVE_jg1418 [Triparma verrucosa]